VEEVAGDQRLRGVARNGVVAGGQLVEGDAEGVEVAALVEGDLAAAGAELLGRRVADLAQEEAGPGQVHGAAQGLGDAQVDELDQGLPLDVLGEHDVVGGDVAVDEVVAVQVGEGLQGLQPELQNQVHAQPAAQAQQLGQVAAVDELHDHHRGAVLADGEVVDLGDVGVAQADRRAGLPQEAAAQPLVGLEVGPDHLDDPDLFEQAVADLVDRPHAALAQLGQHLVLVFEAGELGDGHGLLGFGGPGRV